MAELGNHLPLRIPRPQQPQPCELEKALRRTFCKRWAVPGKGRCKLHGGATTGPKTAALAAVKEKGVLTGVRVERNEQGSPGEFADLENMTADELRAFVAKTAAEILH
jgi:hypothetical protein